MYCTVINGPPAINQSPKYIIIKLGSLISCKTRPMGRKLESVNICSSHVEEVCVAEYVEASERVKEASVH